MDLCPDTFEPDFGKLFYQTRRWRAWDMLLTKWQGQKRILEKVSALARTRSGENGPEKRARWLGHLAKGTGWENIK